jgi:hypothetical protein
VLKRVYAPDAGGEKRNHADLPGPLKKHQIVKEQREQANLLEYKRLYTEKGSVNPVRFWKKIEYRSLVERDRSCDRAVLLETAGKDSPVPPREKAEMRGAKSEDAGKRLTLTLFQMRSSGNRGAVFL